LLASPRRIRLGYDPATGGFYVQAFDGAVTLPDAGYDYDIDWTPMSAGLAPAGMAASFAALGWVERSDTHHAVASSLFHHMVKIGIYPEDWAGDVSNDGGDFGERP